MIIPKMLVIHTQPEEIVADLINLQCDVDDQGDGKLLLTFAADLDHASQADLDAIIHIAKEKIAQYAADHDMQMFNTMSVQLGGVQYNDEDDDFDIIQGGDLLY